MVNLQQIINESEGHYSLVKCPCCGADTLDMFWVCDHCGWEYDGTVDENSYSPSNHTTLSEFRRILYK